MSGVFTIPADRCFVSTLAAGLWRRAKGDPLALSSSTIYLPTRRACRALRDAFLRLTEAKAALLPRLRPLGDSEDMDLDLAEDGAFETLPPALSPLRRQMLLTRAVMKKDENLPLDQAASLAVALADLMDQAENEGLDFAKLEDLAPEDYAEHWQETLLFLEIITKEWPGILADEDGMDPVVRRNALLDAQAQKWLDKPPAFPVIAAGSTGSVPAAGRLMKAIAALPSGEVILPGLDLGLEEEAWQQIEETHPQFTMKNWLEKAKIERKDVPVWENFGSQNPARIGLLREALRPAAGTEAWRKLTAEEVPPEASAGIELLELDHQREEAEAIALRLRAALEEKEKTAAFVTPDRALAARVEAALARWGIEANDSAGSPLPLWPVGGFLMEILEAASETSPVALLSLLKHPLTAAGRAPEACRSLARETERSVWRGVRRAGGFDGAARVRRAQKAATADWLEDIAVKFAAFAQKEKTKRALAEWIDAHGALAEAMAATQDETGAARLWRGPDGEAAAAWLEEWRAASHDFPPLTGRDYARLFAALAQNVAVRPAYGAHPRLSLLGPLEARLLHHDLVILGGLNEGVWPSAPPVDPWMSRPMKKAFGLPSPERRIGLSAHDFVQHICADNILITRARRAGSSPTVPSRFILQLETVLRAAGADEPMRPALPWGEWVRALDEPASVQPLAPPEPCPPLENRPRKLSVTEIGTWLRNPYAIYAKRILGLEKLDPLDADAGAAEQGTAIHEALEKFLAQTLQKWPENPLELLLEEGRKAFAPYADRLQVKAFWEPRFERIARWFVENEESRRAEGIVPLAVEATGVLELPNGFALSGRADRVDLLPEGTVEIVDYKTGLVPSKKQVEAGLEPQLSLLALMAAEGALEKLGARDAAKLSYWALRGRREDVKPTEIKKGVEELRDKAGERLERLVRDYADPRRPYRAVPRPDFVPAFNDYEHLSRVKEWGREREKKGGKG